MDFNIFREESLFYVEECEFLGFRKYVQVLMEYPHVLTSLRSNSLDKLYIFQDLWFFIQYGKQYKSIVVEHEVTLKDVRLSLLSYLITLEELEMAKALGEQERFIFCYRYLTELFDHSRKRLREEDALQEIRDDYYSAMEKNELTKELQQKVITSYYSEWFKQGYLLSKIFQDKLAEIDKICLAMRDVCGLCANESDENIEHFIQAVLRADDLLEIAFWKRKFKAQGLSTLFEHTDEINIPPLVVCVQQSDKMRPLLNIQIGLICAMLVISEEEVRDFVYIPYAEQIGKELYCEKGQVTIAQYIDIVHQFLGGDGGPSYRQLLNIAFTMLKLSAASFGGEIVIMCDDQIEALVPQDEAWQKAVQHYKKEMNIRIIVLHSGTFNSEASIWFADRVMFIEDFQTEIKVM